MGINRYRQHTIATEACISGTGLHTGVHVTIKLKPERPGYGIKFQRVDLPGRPIIAADCDLVSDTFRRTTLTDNNASISTVEHILAATVGTGLDNCLIEVNGPELPIVDGCCLSFVRLIEQAGLVEQKAPKIWYTLDEEISQIYHEQNVKMIAIPFKEYAVETMVDFKSIFLKEQRAVLNRIEDFKNEIAPCRTYCFIHELEMLMDKKLIQGDVSRNALLLIDKPVPAAEMMRLQKKFNLENTLVKNGGYLNNLELRFDNEIAKHKLLDIMGDLSLVGFPIDAKIIGSRPGHTTNVEFAKKIKRHILKKIAGKKLTSRVY
jgi:UDP-3-O-[3-hydroxymyristoyl] N-acetylglucosamine deacetylase/3-hydroxyacyl-[acyl-carrier-protein] dehydratase